MAEIINLNRYRKAKERTKAERKAEENRVSYGRSKAEKELTRRQTDKDAADLDGKRRD